MRDEGQPMQLTLYTDYSLRVLIFLRLHDDRKVTISEIADAYGISKNHLMKVVQQLANEGFVDSSRGRGGGLTLARPPAEINLADVVRCMEPSMALVECFDAARNTCPIAPACDLQHILAKAQQAFMATLDEYTLADIGKQQAQLRMLLGTSSS
jgi:Rrf2 family nitric oxide-sensitive transcriptional repressor